MKFLYQLFLSGLSILFFAILTNLIANQLDFNTWYGFIEEIGAVGVSEAFTAQTISSLIFMFIAYPIILGGAGYLVYRSFK